MTSKGRISVPLLKKSFLIELYICIFLQFSTIKYSFVKNDMLRVVFIHLIIIFANDERIKSSGFCSVLYYFLVG